MTLTYLALSFLAGFLCACGSLYLAVLLVAPLRDGGNPLRRLGGYATYNFDQEDE